LLCQRACVRYGRCLASGFGIAPSPVLAAEFYRRAVSLGDPLGLNEFGACLESGDGHPKDLLRACDCYKSGGAEGSAHAHFNYGASSSPQTKTSPDGRNFAPSFLKEVQQHSVMFVPNGGYSGSHHDFLIEFSADQSADRLDMSHAAKIQDQTREQTGNSAECLP
jgi:hypothetical protein